VAGIDEAGEPVVAQDAAQDAVQGVAQDARAPDVARGVARVGDNFWGIVLRQKLQKKQ